MKLPDYLARVDCPEPVEGQSFVYILYCRNGTLYFGQTHDVRTRIDRHVDGTGARYTKQLVEFVLVYVEGPMIAVQAVKRERQPKKWSKAKKIALVRGDLELLKRLSQSRD